MKTHSPCALRLISELPRAIKYFARVRRFGALRLFPYQDWFRARSFRISSGSDVDRALESLHANRLGKNAAVIGTVVADHPRFVMMKTRIGGTRVVDMLSGEQLPRIC